MQTGRDKPGPADTEREIPKAKQPKREQTSVRILVINGRLAARNKLSTVLERLTDIAVCHRAEQSAQAVQIIERSRIDLAVVDISEANIEGVKIMEEIRMRYPQLPVLAVYTDRRTPAEIEPKSRTAGLNTASPQDDQRVVDAIRYSQSLLRSGVSGFSVVFRI